MVSKLRGSETCIFGNCAHSDRVDGRMPRDNQANLPVAHYDVPSLANNAVAEFFKHSDRRLLANSRNSRHGLDGDVGLFYAS
jgi:hypothetical protein